MPGPVRSISQAFMILRLLAQHGGALTLSEITRATDLSLSSCLNLLRTLVAEGALEAENGKRYRLAAGWAGLAALLDTAQARVIARAQPLLDRFAQGHDATTGLWRLDRRERLELVALGESTSSTRIHMAVGQRQPIGGGSTGRALAAAQRIDEGELARRYGALRWQRPLDFPAYAVQVGAAVASGYAVDDGFGHAGICSIACIVPGEPIAFCLSTSIFAGSREGEHIRALGRALRELAAAIGTEP
ncbi:helix-turn-helix domain-containing protein [Novosphingobium sp.]|uniref:helix-turn-helix domain-containing protein n=1 Tax=Novosphingobium sp. TaxID=1874826 RepID=UPI00273632AF|nr:helix-turn-helix domain-containing protein [Novosphingobium sp.]MDP3905833.1 helix-turn-helix domain-containing protein [Novosphingobium sp.]